MNIYRSLYRYLIRVSTGARMLFEQRQPVDIRSGGQGVIGVVNHEAGRTFIRFADILFLEIIDFQLVTVPSFGIIACKLSGFLEYAVRELFVIGLNNDVRAGDSLDRKSTRLNSSHIH